MNIIKKTYSKNNNEIVLIEKSAEKFSKTILIIGVVHGDEPQGKFLIENYVQNIKFEHKHRLLFVPCLNPDGMVNNTRKNANVVDLNRNFPTKNWGANDSENNSQNSEYFGGESAASEIETKFVIEILQEFSPDVILTIHAPYKVVNYDGPAEKIADEISKIIGYPTSNDIGYPTPGSFGTYAGVERNIPTITLEIDEEIDIKELVLPISRVFDYLAEL